ESFDDFHPESVVHQVPRLAKLLEARQQLRDLLAKLDGNDELGSMLERIVQSTEELKQVQSQAQGQSQSQAQGSETSGAPVAEDAPSA
ncbi:MAG TPA: type VI secretion system contractile sheath small subunit, partial [Paraburkholderia sp.]